MGKENLTGSCLVITCDQEIDPEIDRIELRTNPPKFIDLKPGVNILKVEDYPELKFGFRSVYCADSEYSGIIEVDFSHFDGSEMTSMEGMFYYICPLIKWGNLDTSNVNDMSYMFGPSNEYGNLKLFFSLKSLEKANYMFEGSEIIYTLDLSGIDYKKLTKFPLCISPRRVNNLIIDGWELASRENANIFHHFPGDDGFFIKVSMKGCDVKTIKWICESILDTLTDFDLHVCENFEDHFILDPDIKIKWHKESDTVTVHKCESTDFLCKYSEDGKQLLKVSKKANIVAIKDGVEIIAPEAFKDCEDLTTVFIPNSVIEIGWYAFSGCKSLVEINIPDNVKIIGDSSFQECKELKILHLGKGINKLGGHIFDYSAIKTLSLPLNACRPYLFNEISTIANVIIYAPNFENCGKEIYKMFINCDGIPNIILKKINEESLLPEYPYDENGCIIAMDYSEEYPQVILISKNSFVIPSGVQGLAKNCLTDWNKIIYIPDNIEFIHPHVFKEGYCSLDWIIIKKSFLDKFLEIMPPVFEDIKFILI